MVGEMNTNKHTNIYRISFCRSKNGVTKNKPDISSFSIMTKLDPATIKQALTTLTSFQSNLDLGIDLVRQLAQNKNLTLEEFLQRDWRDPLSGTVFGEWFGNRGYHPTHFVQKIVFECRGDAVEFLFRLDAYLQFQALLASISPPR